MSTSTSAPRPWGECPLVLVSELAAVQPGPTARSMPPIHHSTLTFTVRELLRGDGFAVGSQLVVSHSARQLEPPAYPAIGTPCLLGAVKHAARGMMMRRGPAAGGGAELQAECDCLRLEERTDAAHADAVLGCSLPFGWSADRGAVRSPWAELGAAAWAPAEGSRVLAAADAQVCSVTGRPVLLCGGGSLQLSGGMVPPASAADATAVSRGAKPRGKWPGGWYEWTNPDGDGEYRLTLTNTGAQGDVVVPALLSVGGEPCWSASLLVEHERRCHPLLPPGHAPHHAPRASTPPAALAGKVVQPTTLGPGESLSTTVNVLALEGPAWPRGGSRLEFNFWLGEMSCGPFSLYYTSSHHDVLRKEMGCADMGTSYQGES